MDGSVVAFRRKINDAGLALIKSFEGCKLEAYRCPAGVLTIGWGHTGPDVTEGLRWTQEQADRALLDDIAEKAENPVNKLVTVPLNANQFSALCSLCFNIGAGNFAKSTALQMLNKRMFDQVPLRMMLWVYIKGEENSGLRRRRIAECDLFTRQTLPVKVAQA